MHTPVHCIHTPPGYIFPADMQSDLIIPEVSIYIFIFLSVNKQPIVLGLLRLVVTGKNIAYYLSSRETQEVKTCFPPIRTWC